MWVLAGERVMARIASVLQAGADQRIPCSRRRIDSIAFTVSNQLHRRAVLPDVSRLRLYIFVLL